MAVVVALLMGRAAWARPRWVVTIHPLAAILREVVGPEGDIVTLLPGGASPHTYEPRPSDLRAVDGATALVLVDSALDGWATRLPAPRWVEALTWVPPPRRLPQLEATADHPGAADPHFWTDPETVAAMLPALAGALCDLDAGWCPRYRAGAVRFGGRLAALDRKVARLLAPVRGRAVFLFHPSFQYLLRRHGIVLAGVIEPFPGKEPSPRHLAELVRRLRAGEAGAIFTEPQLPPRPAEVVAEAAGVPVHLLDPNGGVPGRESYAELILFNAAALAAALR